MNIDLNTYKIISQLKSLRIIFLSFLFIFLVNYMSNVYKSYLDISSNTHEISKDFESEEKENERETERETEIEDYDELFLLSISNSVIDIHFKKVYNPYILFENSNFKEVDIPPPIS